MIVVTRTTVQGRSVKTGSELILPHPADDTVPTAVYLSAGDDAE
jgi:hypothetical protein